MPRYRKSTPWRIALAAVLGTILAASCARGPVTGGPKNRAYAVSAWDQVRGRMLLVEGQYGANVTPVPSWTWDPAARVWEKMAGLGAPMPTVALDWDADRKKAVCFVSTRWHGMPTATLEEVVDNVSETWEYDATADAWTRLETIGTPTPGLLGSRMVYDAKARRMVLFGGYVTHGPGMGYANETWAFDPATAAWTLMAPPESPAGRNYHEMAWDRTSGLVVAYGSDQSPGGPGSTKPFETTTWLYDLAANAWKAVEATPNPGPVVYAAMVGVPELGGCLLFGGVSNHGEKPRAGTWLFTVAGGWSRIETTAEPTPRGWHSMAYDPVGQIVWLYGGGSRRNTATSELWYFDLKDRDWHRIERDAGSYGD